jgi:hypothetical protein
MKGWSLRGGGHTLRRQQERGGQYFKRRTGLAGRDRQTCATESRFMPSRLSGFLLSHALGETCCHHGLHCCLGAVMSMSRVKRGAPLSPAKTPLLCSDKA